MPPVKMYWYDAMRDEQPKFSNAPQGEILGDLPDNRVGRADQGIKPKERQIIGEVFTEQFFSPKQMQPKRTAAPRPKTQK